MQTSRTTAKQKTTSSSSGSKPKPRAAEKATPLPPVNPKASPLDNAVGYQIDKQVNLPQLQSEIKQATGTTTVNVAITSIHGGDVLWLTPAGLDADTLATVVQNHVPNPLWGVPSVIQDFNQALSRLRENPDGELPDGDLVSLVKGIALNFTALMPPPS